MKSMKKIIAALAVIGVSSSVLASGVNFIVPNGKSFETTPYHNKTYIFYGRDNYMNEYQLGALSENSEGTIVSNIHSSLPKNFMKNGPYVVSVDVIPGVIPTNKLISDEIPPGRYMSREYYQNLSVINFNVNTWTYLGKSK